MKELLLVELFSDCLPSYNYLLQKAVLLVKRQLRSNLFVKKVNKCSKLEPLTSGEIIGLVFETFTLNISTVFLVNFVTVLIF